MTSHNIANDFLNDRPNCPRTRHMTRRKRSQSHPRLGWAATFSWVRNITSPLPSCFPLQIEELLETPPSDPGKPFNGLWDYEVIEAFFLNGQTEQYLEVELCPHGQYLILLLCGRRKVLKQELPLKFEVSRTSTQWNGRAHLPWSYLPPATDQFNAFAIHGSGEARTYEALYPVPQHEMQKDQQPDFHRLEYFKCFNLKTLMGQGWKQPVSVFWAP